MILEPTAEQQAYQAHAAAFATRAVEPLAAVIDERNEFPRAIVAAAAAEGLLGITLAPQWGGGGRDYVSYALALEALARASSVIAVIVSVHTSLVAEPIAQFGSEAQKQLWLPRLASGESIGAFALSEEQAGSDAANQQTVARLDDRGYVINGRKVWVANAAAADLVLLFAATQPGMRGRGISAFLVPMETPGIERVAANDSLGVRGLGCMDLELRDVRVDADALVGAPGRWLRHRAAGARRRTGGDRGAGARRRHRRARGSPAPRAGASRLRPADRQLPGDPVDARRHGHRTRCRADADAEGGRRPRP